MTDRHYKIIEKIKKDDISIHFVKNQGSPGKYEIKNDNCIIYVDIDIMNGKDPLNFNDKRCELVLYHEWGHIIDYRKDKNRFMTLNSLNSCHEDLEFEAYFFAFQIAVFEAQKGDNSLLLEAHKRYQENITKPDLDDGYKLALEKIFQSDLWKSSQSFII